MSKRALLALLVACDSTAADQPDAGLDGRPIVGCDAPLGTQHAQTLATGDGVEDRAYWLHVPASYRCESPAPLLVDFHGTSGDLPEEAYQTDALVAFADAHGVIVVRPRSRSSAFMGANIYRWDQNPGDLARNVTFRHNLVADLEQRYAIDPARVYASGFSTGSNMTAQFLTDPASPFQGLAPAWSRPPRARKEHRRY
jgi:polyhydroxybutyrate depolymerase